MTDALTLLKQTLQAGQHSFTQTRQLVFTKLLADGPLSMPELVAACNPLADRASVYRTVLLFEQLSIVQRIQTGWKYRIELSDQFQPHHHHMYCTGCSSTIELPENKALESQLMNQAKAQGFQPLDHQIEIRGLCQSCVAADVHLMP